MTFHEPTPEELRDAITLITTAQLRRVFFSRLENPLWVRPLAEAGSFADPPEPVTGDDGVTRDEPWPEIDYLVRVASAAPQAVVDVAQTLIHSNNVWVRRGLVAISALVPPSEAALMAKEILRWKVDATGWRTDPIDLVTLSVHLLEGGFTSLGTRLAERLFRPRKGSTGTSRRAEVALDGYWYEELLPRVIQPLGATRLAILTRWLEDYETYTGQVAETGFFDLSHMTRAAISSRPEYSDEIRDSLIDVVRDVAVDQMKLEPEKVVGILAASGQTLSRRICLYSAALALEERPDDGRLRTAVLPMVSWPELGWPGFRSEFARFLRALASATGNSESLSPIEPTLDAGPFGSRELLAERLRRPDQGDEELSVELASYLRDWRHRILSAIGAEALPTVLAEELGRLDAQLGALDLGEEGRLQVVEWQQDESPVNAETLGRMDAAAILSFLETWHPDGTQWRGPTHVGLGKVVRDRISVEPGLMIGMTSRVLTLRPAYLHAVLSGWREAIKTDREPPWDDVIAVVAATLGHDLESPFTPEGDDTDFRSARMEALRVAGAILELGDGRAPGPAVVEILASALISMVEDSVTGLSYAESSRNMDPLTLSLNTELPLAVRDLTLLAGSPRLGDDGHVLRTLELVASRPDPHGAVAAVLGEALSRFFNRRGAWLAEHATAFFGTAATMTKQQQVSFTTALATQRIHSKLIDVLRGSFEYAIKSGAPMASGWSSMRSAENLVGDWIIVAFLSGGLTEDDPLIAMFFEYENVPTRADVLGHVGWAFMRAEQVDPEPLSRAMDLWDQRASLVSAGAVDADELADFYWWVRSQKFPVEWWAPRLQFVATAAQVNTRGLIGEQLVRAARDYPREIFEAARALVRRPTDDQLRSYDLLERAIPAILAAALDSDDEQLHREATELMHELGAQGLIELDRRVIELRQR